MSADPVLHLLAGPNGSGKSTFWRTVLEPETGLPFVNADQLAEALWPENPGAHAEEARVSADLARDQYVHERRSFGTETVFSHESRVGFIRDAVAAGYLVTLHVLYVDADTAVGRVGVRKALGGHDVAENKIRGRHPRIWGHVAEATPLVENAVIFDARGSRRPVPVARFHRGKLTSADWPDGFPEELTAFGG